MNDYAQGYQLAVRHFESKDFIGAVKLAKYNLTDLHVPRYWQIKNCILVAYGTDDWYEAEEYRDAGELAYSLYHKATEPSDRSHQEALASVRVSLDQLAKQQTFLKPTDEDDYLEFEDESGEEDGGEEDGGDFGKEDEEDIEDPEEFIHIEDKQERLRKVLSNPDINAIETKRSLWTP
ncbi:hypothetical protein HII31_04473 [Pseudocercospora fuligena]|uniref:Uncharacterized protein n=1 Tax=Pseudocercospora fuligena TaxID=685502 RepID=A0A8H6RKS0_9PEZI|nr:hypothetical protein HII31_04473 [Pseudocercospora fuligena]